MTLLDFIVQSLMRAAHNAELRREAALKQSQRGEVAVVPADMSLPRPVRDVGGHDASGEGR